MIKLKIVFEEKPSGLKTHEAGSNRIRTGLVLFEVAT